MLVRDVVNCCSHCNIVLDSENDPFFGSAPVFLRHAGITQVNVLRRFGYCHVKEILYDEMFIIKI